MICAKCKKRFNGEPLRYKKINDEEEITITFCFEELRVRK